LLDLFGTAGTWDQSIQREQCVVVEDLFQIKTPQETIVNDFTALLDLRALVLALVLEPFL